MVNGKRQSTDINLYKLFVEQCFNLLRSGGHCGIVIPSGIYTDLGAKQLRELLFDQTAITGLFCFENRKEIFEGVDSRFKFVVLTFGKGGNTKTFPAAFMRHNVEELEYFPKQGALPLAVDLIRRLSPDSLSVMEFKNETDVRIAEKMLRFPHLGEKIEGKWNITLKREFHMTDDSKLFKPESGQGRLLLYEGKMVHQFDHRFSEPRYWVVEKEGRKALLHRERDVEQKLEYQSYRLGFRDVARNTDERTMIAAVLPPNIFAGNTVTLSSSISGKELFFVTALLNSFPVDFIIRQKVTAHCNMFYVYQLPVPRLTEQDPAFAPLVDRVAKLICTTPEFDDLARDVGLGSHKNGVTDPTERAKLRAELDGLIAHLYGLTEEEFAYILTTFPLVKQSVKDAGLAAYKTFAPKSADQQLAAIIATGESATVEFKSSARWDMRENKPSKVMEQVIVKTVAAFLSSAPGGTLLIGVDDDGTVVGLAHDYKTLGKRQNRDGYENWLLTLLLDQFGKDCSPLLRVTFHDMAGQDVCQVLVKPSPKPVYVTDGNAEHMFIRTGNSTRQLTTREAVEYCKQRWG